MTHDLRLWKVPKYYPEDCLKLFFFIVLRNETNFQMQHCFGSKIQNRRKKSRSTKVERFLMSFCLPKPKKQIGKLSNLESLRNFSALCFNYKLSNELKLEKLKILKLGEDWDQSLTKNCFSRQSSAKYIWERIKNKK